MRRRNDGGVGNLKNNVFDTMKGRITNEFRTICEVHREIYDECWLSLHEVDPATMERLTVLLNEAFDMGVRMDAALVKYHLAQEGVDVPNEGSAKREERVKVSERILRSPQT